jgi:hypothetical protein
MSGAKTLEDVIRWGSAELFSNFPDSQSEQQAGDAAAAGEGGAAAAKAPDAAKQEAAAAARDVEMAEAAAPPGSGAAAGAAGAVVPWKRSQLIAYTPDQLAQVLSKGAAACAAALSAGGAGVLSPRAVAAAAAAGGDAAADGASAAGDFGAGLEMVAVRAWPDVDRGVDEEVGEWLRAALMLCLLAWCVAGAARTWRALALTPCYCGFARAVSLSPHHH